MLKYFTLTLFFFCGILIGELEAQTRQAFNIAEAYLQDNHAELGLTVEDIRAYEITNQYVTQHNQLTHVYLRQTYGGIPVHNAILNLNILPNGEILSIGNRFVRELAEQINTTVPIISTRQAVTVALDRFDLPGANFLVLATRPDAQTAIYRKEGVALRPISVSLT